MSRTLKFFLLLLSFSPIFLGCEKEFSEENGGAIGAGGTTGGTSVFTLEGAPGACTTPAIAGSYKAGTALTASETITLIVNVTTPGTYTISSGTANGITFSDAGTFAAAGLTFIELKAVGQIPTATGTFNYKPGTNSCSFAIKFNAPSGTSSGTSVYTFKGAPDKCSTPVIEGTYKAGTALTAANKVKLLVEVTTLGTYSISTGSANGIKFTATGTFTALGENTIELIGEGTPVSESTVDYVPGSNGCTFEIKTTAGSTTPPPAGGDYIRATINGVAMSFDENLTGMGDFTTPANLNLDGESTDLHSMGLTFVNQGGSTIPIGNYSNISASNLTRFGTILYEDGVGGTFTCISPTANQITIKLTAISATRATGTFSGKITDMNGANAKTITNGSFSVPLQ